MAYDRALAERVRAALADHPAVREVREVKMFGGLSFMVNGKLAVAADAHGDLLLRCDPARADDLVGDRGASWAEMQGTRMGRGWLTVSAERLDSADDLGFWIAVALDYNGEATR